MSTLTQRSSIHHIDRLRLMPVSDLANLVEMRRFAGHETFTTTDLIEQKEDVFLSDLGTRVDLSANAEYGRMLSRLRKILRITFLKSIRIKDREGNRTTTAVWEIHP